MVEARIGIAAGMIKRAGEVPTRLLDTVSHVTVGSYTLLPCDGNPDPAWWYSPEHRFMINAIGLKNIGLSMFLKAELGPMVEMFKGRLAQLRVSLAPTRAGELAEMVELLNFYHVGELIDELEINGACPNHRNEGKLHPVLARDPAAVEALLKEAAGYHGAKALKIAPGTDYETLEQIVELCDASSISTIVSANTLLHDATIDGKQRLSVEKGGVSGYGLLAYSLVQIGLLRHILDNSGSSMKLIGCGGVMEAEGAENLLTEQGADELQVATLFWNHGARAVAELVSATTHRLQVDALF